MTRHRVPELVMQSLTMAHYDTTDAFGAGCVLFYSLSGRFLFEGQVASTILKTYTVTGSSDFGSFFPILLAVCGVNVIRVPSFPVPSFPKSTLYELCCAVRSVHLFV